MQSAAAAAAALCVAILLLLLQLLLAAAVRDRVQDGKNCCWFIESDSSVSLQTRFMSMYPLTELSQLRSRFVYTTSSVNTGMRGAKAGISPPRRSPPCIYPVYHKCDWWCARG